MQGFASAQLNLGLMYNQGSGVLQDYKEAVKWYAKGAEQGDAHSQRNLGVMFRYGKGVPQDFREAHMWFNLAAANGNDLASNNRDGIAKGMTSEQIAEAQKMAREWMEEHGDL